MVQELVYPDPPKGGSTDLAPDVDIAIKFLQALRPNGPWVLTAIEPDGETVTIPWSSLDEAKTAPNGKTSSLREAIEGTNRNGWNIYYTGNLCGQPRKKPDKAAMTGAVMLHTDDDPRDGETPEAAKARILAAYEAHDPPPSVVIDFGQRLAGAVAAR